MKIKLKNIGLWLVLIFLLKVNHLLADAVDCSATATTGIPESECFALVDLYNATGGDNWNNSTNWKTAGVIDSWYGVTVANGNVVRLYLHDNNLVGSLPSTLGNLTKLSWLFLDINQLTGSIPSTLGNLHELTYLVLGANQLSGSIPSQLGNLGNLAILALKDNLLSGSIPPELGRLAKLEDLDFSSNKLSGSIPQELGALSVLERMIVARNKLSGQLPDALGDLAALRVLDLHSNQLTGFIPKTLGKLKNVESLEFGSNKLTGPIPAELGVLGKLWNLDLYNNYLTGEIPPELGNLISLTDMQIYGNRLIGAVPDALAGLTGLQVFQVDHNQLDADASGDALLSPVLQAWYAGIDPATKDISHQHPPAVPWITVEPTTGLITKESGEQSSFGLVLETLPTADVHIQVTSSDPGEGTVSPVTVTFTPVDWFDRQTVMLNGVNDDEADGNQEYTISFSVTSNDTQYDGFQPDTVSAVNIDDDQEGITVYPTSGLMTSEAGGEDTFQVVLNSQPAAEVTISLSSSDTSEGLLVNSNNLVFTPDNWNISQTVTVEGVDDGGFDGDVVYTIVVDAVSSDPSYQGIDPDDVEVTNIDDESDPALAGVTVDPTSGLRTDEKGAIATFTVVLDSQPGSDVVVRLASSDPGEGSVSPTTLTFKLGNWDTAQTVTVRGVDDVDEDGDQAYGVVISVDKLLTLDASYQRIDPDDVSLINIDDDINTVDPGISVSPTGGLVTTEAGGTASFRVRLNTKPSEAVTLGLVSSDPTEGAIGVSSLTFTQSDWETWQTVTITGIEDLELDGDQPYFIETGTVVSADPAYDGLNPIDVSVTNWDNDLSCSSPPDDVVFDSSFPAGKYLCIGVKSISTDPKATVTIEDGAEVHLQAPVLEFHEGFSVENGGTVNVQPPQAP